MNKIISYFRESKEELRKVNWPTKQQTIRYTGVIIGASLVMAIFLGVLDIVFSKVIENVIF